MSDLILGLDNGYLDTKDNYRHVFRSAYTQRDGTLAEKNKIIIDGTTYYFGLGDPTIDTDKTSHLITKICTLADLALLGDRNYYLVVGLPINQYREQRERFRDQILQYNKSEVFYNGKKLNFSIKDVKVFAQGAAVLYNFTSTDTDYIILDIGSNTINAALVEYTNGIPSIIESNTWFFGVLNLYEKIISEVNQKHTLTLDPGYAKKIIEKGLNVDGEKIDTAFVDQIILEYLDPILTQFKLRYKMYMTTPIILCGGGSILLKDILLKKFKNAVLMPDSQFANADGYYKIGLQVFGKYVNNRGF